MGPSGSGKTTFLNLICGVLPLQTGSITLGDIDYKNLNSRALDQLRADRIGVIFQTLNLIPYLSGYANIELGLKFSKERLLERGAIKPETDLIAQRLGLTPDLLSAPSSRLSIGQQQRVAVIRALIGKPALILADEPTSALDPEATQQFMDEMLSTLNETEQAVLMVSHNPNLVPYFDRVVGFTKPC